MVSAAVAKNLAEGPARARASYKRRRAVRDIVTGAAPVPDTVSPDMARSAAREASRTALQLARSAFDHALGENSEALAGKLVELAMGGSIPALLTVARSIVPPARFDSTRIELDVGRIETPDDIDRARRRLAEAVFNGQVGVEDATHLGRLLDSLSESALREQKTALVHDMRAALAEQRAPAARIASLTARAEIVLQGLATSAAPMIEAEPDDSEDWRCLL